MELGLRVARDGNFCNLIDSAIQREDLEKDIKAAKL